MLAGWTLSPKLREPVKCTNDLWEKIPPSDMRSGRCSPSILLTLRKQLTNAPASKTQLADGFRRVRLSVQFDYQGSVTNDTHIRVYSDVDLLTVEQRSYHAVEPPSIQPLPPYLNGDPTSDLKEIRRKTTEILRSAFPATTVDQSKGKCPKYFGGITAT